MPLAWQVMLPFAVLLGTALLVQRPNLRQRAGRVAAAGTAAAGLAMLFQLVRLAPGARVDLLYLRAFPGADLGVRLDGLSVAFAVVMLATAAVLMLARSRAAAADRREPWRGWLLTTAAALAVILAGNLLLAYIALQVLTLAWSGALDERSRRTRVQRIAHQVADVGLLLAAAAMINSVGTSAFAGLPSDALGPFGFALALLPVVARVATLALSLERPATPVLFDPVIAWAAPAGYLFLRLLSLTGGRAPGRPAQTAAFVLAGAGAGALCWLALQATSWPRQAGRLLGMQAALAMAFGAVGTPPMTLASGWLWLQIVPLAGLCAVRPASGSLERAGAAVGLTMLPPATGFAGLWLGISGLAQAHVAFAAVPVGLLAVGAFVAAGPSATLSRPITLNLKALWTAVLGVGGLFAGPVLQALALPVAWAVRSLPPEAFGSSLVEVQSGGSRLPVTLVAVAATAVLALTLSRYVEWARWMGRWRPGILPLPRITVRVSWPGAPPWPWPALGWIGFAVVAGAVAFR